MAYLALYRKYRPRDFDSVVGQEYVTRILKNQILSGRIGHAYLFSGIRGTGKTSIAKIFARAINCENNTDGNPCGKCETCLNIEKPGVMDILEIDAASNRGVDEIREIRERVKFPPTMGKYKVYIIDEVHMLTKEAFNALLKTLEEPPSHVVFILATTEPNKLPATILSRCQRFDIRPISREMIMGRMQAILDDMGIAVEHDALEFIAWRGDSSMRDALSLLDQVIDIRDGDKPITYQEVLDFLGMAGDERIHQMVEAIIAQDRASVLSQFAKMRQMGRDAALVYNELIEYLRKMLIADTAAEAANTILGLNDVALAPLKAIASQCGRNKIYAMLDLLITERDKLRLSGLAPVVMEMTLLKLCEPDLGHQSVQVAQSAVSSRPMSSVRNGHTTKMAQTPSSRQTPNNEAVIDNKETARSMPVSLENRAEANESKQEKAAISTETPKKKGRLNTDGIYKILVQNCIKGQPMATAAIQNARLVQTGECALALTFQPENAAYARLLKMPLVFNYLKNIIDQLTHNTCTLEIQVAEQTYENMSMIEKTRSIINDASVEIVEVKDFEK